MAASNKRGPKVVTASHKAAMAAGRNESRAMSTYLEALSANKPKRGRKRTRETITGRLDAIAGELPDADMLTRVHLIQERLNLEGELATMDQTVDLSAFEADFLAVAKSYSTRKGITYAAWREAGLDAAILTKAGITR